MTPVKLVARRRESRIFLSLPGEGVDGNDFSKDRRVKDIPSLIRLFLQLGYPTEADSLKRHIGEAQSSMSMLVAASEEEVCGVVVINFITPVHENGLWALISALVIDESARGEGTGQKLLLAAGQLAADKNCSQIELSSSETRVRAHKFYESNGYREVRKRFVKRLADLPVP